MSCLKNYLQSPYNTTFIPVPTRDELVCALNEIKCEYRNKVPHAHHDRDHIAKNLVELTRCTKDDNLAICLLNTLINHPLYTDRLSSQVMKPVNNAYTHIHNFFSMHEKSKSFGTCSETIAIHELNRREEARNLKGCNVTPVIPNGYATPVMNQPSVTPVIPSSGSVTPVIPNNNVTPVLPNSYRVTPVIPSSGSSVTPVLPSNDSDSNDYVPVLPRMGR